MTDGVGRMGDRCTRRRFLRRSAALGAAALGGVPWLAACGGSKADHAALAEQARALGSGLDCTDTRGLQQAEILTRETNGYVESSSRPGEYCFVCENYQPPESPGSCATCKTVRGPINPAGWCEAWVRARR